MPTSDIRRLRRSPQVSTSFSNSAADPKGPRTGDGMLESAC